MNNSIEKKYYGNTNISSIWSYLFSKNYVNPSSPKVRTISNGFVLPIIKGDIPLSLKGGVLDSNKNFVGGILRHTEKKNFQPACEEPYLFNENDVPELAEKVIFGGVLFHHFGHLLVDSLSRLWFVIKNKTVLNDHKIVFISYGKESEYIYEFLDFMNIPLDRVIFLRQITKFKEIIVPEQSGYTLHYAHKEFLLPYDEIASSCKIRCAGPTYNKVYLSKAKASNPGFRLIGEKYFEKFFQSKGYKILYPDEMSLAEKVYLVSNADEMVSFYGTISHYSLFAKQSCKIVTLTRTANEYPLAQALFNNLKNQNCCIVDCSYNFLYSERGQGVSLVCPTVYWKNFVKDTFGESVTESIDGEFILDYIKYFYEFYKSKNTFNFEKDSFARDFFERCAKIFYDEQFTIPNERQNQK